MSAPAIPQGDLSQRIVAAVRGEKKPVTFKNLAKLTNAEHEPLRVALDSAIGAGQVYRWPDYRRAQYFWSVSPEQAAREAILMLAATRALSKPALSRAARKSQKLAGFSAKSVENLVADLVAEKQLHAVPGFAGRAKLLVRSGDSQAYFNTARSFMELKIRAAGFDPAAFFEQNPTAQSEPANAQVDAAQLILEAVRSLEPVRGVPVSTLRLRSRFPHLSKQEFDDAALELRKKEQVSLSLHADAHNLSQEDRDLLIDGQDGTHYVAIAIR